MKQNLLINKMYELQHDYCELLKELLPIVNTEYYNMALDKVIIFWRSNTKIIDMYLRHYVSKYDAYVFTGATYMDVSENEQYPFMLFGDFHIMDDSLCKMSQAYNGMDEEQVAESSIETLCDVIKDNIRIIEECHGKIIVVPVSLLNRTFEKEEFVKMGEQLFISLFHGIESIKDFLTKCNTIDDIISFANDNFAKFILFDQEDDPKSDNISERFNAAKSRMPTILGGINSDAKAFFLLVYGNLSQALDIVLEAVEYEMVPFIRNDITLYYVLLLLEALSDVVPHDLKNKIRLANLTYNICDREQLCCRGFETYTDVLEREGFGTALWNKVGKTIDGMANQRIDSLIPTVTDSLNKLYASILSQ